MTWCRLGDFLARFHNLLLMQSMLAKGVVKRWMLVVVKIMCAHVVGLHMVCDDITSFTT